jgi:cation diffusion facilitator CzcD-associated flavoprotein CzcO
MNANAQFKDKKALEIPGVDAAKIYADWLSDFGAAIERNDVSSIVAMLAANCYWKDVLALTWDYPTFAGSDQIQSALEEHLGAAQISNLRESDIGQNARLVKRNAKLVIEAFFDFDHKVGKGRGCVRLQVDPENPENPKVWTIMLALQELAGFEEAIGSRRTIGDEFSQYKIKENWKQVREAKQAFADRDPEVVILGAGHTGCILAARLGLMGADALVVEKEARIGDTWRKRYHSLTLHNQTIANDFPFMPFPPSFPMWLSKDKLGDWIESYADAMEVNAWTSTELLASDYDANKKRWTIKLNKNGEEKTIHCKHFVIATGVSGSIPKMPHIAGMDSFKGKLIHSAEFSTGAEYKGKRCLVIGTGNSGHDVAQDLVVNEAGSVDILQRSPTCVVSLEPTATNVFKVYGEGAVTEAVDLMSNSIPYPVLEDTYKHMVKRAKRDDEELIAQLNEAGFETYYGSDDTGFHMMYLRGEGGYYIDVGCCQMIIDGRVKVVQTRDMEQFVEDGLLMKDGSVKPYDLIVMATGFNNMQENNRKILGDDVADKVGSVWGFDEHHMMKNMWKKTAQENLWIMGGALIDARVFSRYLAVQLVADLRGIEL